MAENDETAAGGPDATQPSAPPTQPSAPPTEPTPAATQAAPAPTAPSPPKPPKKTGGGGGSTVPLPAFIVVAVVAVAALVFGIFSFTGKSSADDDKKKAEDRAEQAENDLAAANDEIAAANDEITALEEENAALGEDLTGSEDFAAALDEVLGTGQTAADSLYDCSVTAYEFILNYLNSNNPDPGQAQAVDDRCLSAEDNYNAFITALNGIE
jgi:uncharacterized protein HemX